jgi:histidinol-phosphate phosphatase family protein
MPPSFDIVVPTIGRPSLSALLVALATSRGQTPSDVSLGRVLLVYDGDSDVELPRVDGLATEVLRGPGHGPAAARNVGWRTSRAEWIAFLDDDVVPDAEWVKRLGADLAGLPADVAGSQGRVVVPLPADRKPTDWERNVAGLEHARWATADLAYRRRVLAEVGGFDERFRRAYREDADLALRIERAGHRLVRGQRRVTHPVPSADRWVSVRLQAGNADDALLTALHGSEWRERCGEPRGRRRRHLAVTAAGLVALAGVAAGRRRVTRVGAAAWLAGTAELAWARIAPGPRTADELATMAVTSTVLPAAASLQWLRGLVRARRLVAAASPPRPDAVLFDRDGTLVVDVPYNGVPERVVPMPGAREALDRLRHAGVPVAVVSNQSGVARGLVTMDQVEAVNRRIEELLGPLGPWVVCPHGPDDGCGCRKPGTGLIEQAAERLGVEPSKCAVVGDIGSDVEAAEAAGARAVLVPTQRTRPEEVAAAREVVDDLTSAVDLLLRGRP